MQNDVAHSFSFKNDLALYSSHAEGLAEDNETQPGAASHCSWQEIPRNELQISEQWTLTGTFKGLLTLGEGRVTPCLIKTPTSK